MRDPRRIKRVLQKLQAVWEAHPDMRLTQVIGNCMPEDEVVYYMEDDRLEAALTATYLKGGTHGT